jgi:hypothetical protein
MINTPVTTSTGGPQAGGNQNPQGANVDDVLGVNLINIGATAVSGSVQTPTTTNIDSYHGLPLTVLHCQLALTNTAGNTTAPATPQAVENMLKLFRFQSINGQYAEPLFNMDGTYLNISRWQRMKNPYGYYVTGPLNTDSTTATAVTTTWNFDLYYTVTPELFPVRPTVSINTLTAMYGTVNLASGSVTFTVTGDYTRSGIGARRTRLKNLAFGQASTGSAVTLQQYEDKGVTVVQQAHDVGIDTNLSTSNTWNLSIQGQQVFNNKPYQDIVNSENVKFPGTSHISGFFPFSVADSRIRYFDNTLSLTGNFSSAPYINASSGPNSYTSTMASYLEEAF